MATDRIRLTACGIFLAVAAQAVVAADKFQFHVSGDNASLTEDLRQASLVVQALENETSDAATILGAALSDYGNLVAALYANGYYSSAVSIQIAGQEANQMTLLNAPDRVDDVSIRIDPGQPFTFGEIEIGPVPDGHAPFNPAPTTRAKSTVVRDAVSANIDAWRDAGHAKAKPVSERVVANHQTATLDVAVRIAPGPRVRIGDLVIASPSAVRAERIQRIAGLETGTVFSPAVFQTVTTRLRRTGAFSSVTLREAETLGPGDTMDAVLNVVDAKPRRFGIGAEVSSFEGLELSGFWLHRNLLGGAERLRLDAEVSNIGGDAGGVDYAAGARFEVPAAFGSDTTGFAVLDYERLDEPDYRSESYRIGIGATRIFSEHFEAEIGVNYEYADTRDDLGDREFTLISLPVSGTWDHRDDPLNPSRGSYFSATLTPFLGLDGTKSGLRSELDARAFQAIGGNDGIVLAGRIKLGSVAGPEHLEVRPDYLFFSGGGGTVRGQPYQSLDVDLGGGIEIGGRSFLGVSAEVRARLSAQFGAVLFADAGYIGAESLVDGSGEWHSGAGIGLRYQTGLGPIRFDVAGPVGGDTGAGVQLYLGIGQAF